MSVAPDPSAGDDGRDVCHTEAVRFHALAVKATAAGDPLKGIAWALLAIEQRLEEQSYILGDVAQSTGYIG